MYVHTHEAGEFYKDKLIQKREIESKEKNVYMTVQ